MSHTIALTLTFLNLTFFYRFMGFAILMLDSTQRLGLNFIFTCQLTQSLQESSIHTSTLPLNKPCVYLQLITSSVNISAWVNFEVLLVIGPSGQKCNENIKVHLMCLFVMQTERDLKTLTLTEML